MIGMVPGSIPWWNGSVRKARVSGNGMLFVLLLVIRLPPEFVSLSQRWHDVAARVESPQGILAFG
jgi:hypothetical protein